MIWIMSLLFFVAYISRRSLCHLHMMQLNSYLNKRYFVWLKERGSRVFLLREALPLMSLAGFIFGWPLFASAFLLTVYALLTVAYRREKEKKPLVMTLRARRLYATTIVITTALAVSLGFWGISWLSLLILIITTFCSFILMVAANTLLIPLEGFINKRFFKDAKRIIDSMPCLTAVGITGSYGKTSTKFILGEILSERYLTLVSPDSYNTPMGLSRVIREMLKPTHEMLVAEMGARQSGDIKELCGLISPKAGIITAVGEQHLETFKSLENIINTKFELMASLSQEGILVVNLDDENIRKGLEVPHRCRIVGYSLSGIGDYYAEYIKTGPKGSSFVINAPEGITQEFNTVLLGRHNVANIIGAVAMAHQLGVSLKLAARAVKRLPAVPHRLTLTVTAQGYNIIDDAFNANPAGAAAALEVLDSFDTGCKIIITPGMVELGEKQYQLNKEFGLAAAAVCDYIILVGPQHTKPLADGIREAAFPEENLYIASDLTDARRQMLEWAMPGDTILFENDLPDTYNE